MNKKTNNIKMPIDAIAEQLSVIELREIAKTLKIKFEVHKEDIIFNLTKQNVIIEIELVRAYRKGDVA